MLLFVYEFPCEHACSVGCRPRRGIARSDGNSVFDLLGNCQTVFQVTGDVEVRAEQLLSKTTHFRAVFSFEAKYFYFCCHVFLVEGVTAHSSETF